MSNKKILITGALGHIGSKLIHGLNKNEFGEIILIDNMMTQRYASLFNLPEDVNFKFIENDILKLDLKNLLQGIDYAIHFAAITDAAGSFNRKSEIEKVNHEGTIVLAEACKINGVKLLFPSTTSVYGSQSSIIDETCSINELKPQSPYAEYKLKSEQILSKIFSEKLDLVICRFGTIFGKSIGMRFHTAVNKFCWQAVLGQPLTVWETAMNQKRPYLGIDDAVESIKFILNKNIFDGEVYNVVSSNNTVSEIIELIKIHVPDLNVKLVDSQIMNQLSYHVRSQKFEKLGFKFNNKLTAYIEETIKQFHALVK